MLPGVLRHYQQLVGQTENQEVVAGHCDPS